MSKNVAVFVDVANIFYAAKAAGVDIDYVTLLKAAIAGRDFVRAYAYTGLDPENENQRQFHSFLQRSGYKVVSKDIRKYGDGKIKANLDIELVVDLMRTARNLDVAVVVSGDGDFAPAIRAVQQTGVRVEVISFRGNTSSDLMEVADVFTDISQIARVEKGSGRSGRRVAAAGDLSMTEVPDKETEGLSRRRRTGRSRPGTREELPARRVASAASGEAAAIPANLIVLPGEKLSRVAPTAGDAGEEPEETEGLEEAVVPVVPETANGVTSAEGDGRRRRRRRGGRGRGRARTGDRELLPLREPGLDEDEDEADIAPPRVPQHSTFGSVWDSQLGVPSAPSLGDDQVEDEELEDEPAIPEYLLAERRQRSAPGGPRAGGPRGGRGAAYQSAVERERYGRGGVGGGGLFGGPRREERGRDDRGRGGRPPRFDRGPRPGREARGPRQDRHSAGVPRTGDPWTEVPPELEEVLRAQLAQKSGGGHPAAAQGTEGLTETAESLLPASDDEASRADGGAPPATREPQRRSRGGRRTATSAEPGSGEASPADATETAAGGTDTGSGEVTATAETPRRGGRRPASRPTARRATEGGAEDVDDAAAGDGDVPRARRASRPRAAAPDAGAPDAGTAPDSTADGAATAADETAADAPRPKRRTTRKTSPEPTET